MNTYRILDGGYANISVYNYGQNYGQFSRMARDMMYHPVLSDEVWQDRSVRRENREIIDAYVQEYVETVECDELVERGQSLGVPVIPVLTVDGFVNHPHAAARGYRGYFIEMDYPVIGPHRVLGLPVRLGATPWEPRRLAPLLGQHTKGVIRELEEIPPRHLASVVSQKTSGDGGETSTIQPVDGIRIADLTRVVAGPVATRCLSMFCAQNIKIEEAVADQARDLHKLNWCKLSCIIDARKPGGKELIHQLVGVSVVVVENIKPGVMGNSGLLPDYLAYGQQVMGFTGLTHLWGHPESSLDLRIKMPYPDFVAGAFTALVILAALAWRDRTGEGQYMEIAQIEGTAHLLGVAY